MPSLDVAETSSALQGILLKTTVNIRVPTVAE